MDDPKKATSIYDFTANDINGNEVLNCNFEPIEYGNKNIPRWALEAGQPGYLQQPALCQGARPPCAQVCFSWKGFMIAFWLVLIIDDLVHRTNMINKYRTETCCVIGNYYSLRFEQMFTSRQRALKLNPGYLSALTLMGHEYMEMKNTHAAIQSYR